MKKKTIFLLLIITIIPFWGFSAERIPPAFFVDTETSIYIPLEMSTIFYDNSSGPTPFGISQTISFVNPFSSIGPGIRVALERSVYFKTLTLPVYAILSLGYNFKLGGGVKLLLGEPDPLTIEPSSMITSGFMSFSLPIIDMKGTKLGMLCGFEVLTWSKGNDMWGDSLTEISANLLLGVSLTFDPVANPINRILFPKYVKTFE